VLKECTLSDLYCVAVNVVLNFAFSFIFISLLGNILIKQIMYFAENMKGWQLVCDVLTLGAAEFEIFLGNLQ